MIVGGACIDGERQGKIATKLANFIVGSKILQEKNLKTLFDAHWQQLKQFNSGALYLVDENPERRAIFQDDMRKLKEWVRKPHLSGAETRDAAILLYRWLLDKHPMLQDLCNELGIQLTLPGYSEKRRSRYEMDVFNTAIFGLPLEIGKGISFGYQWVTRDKFSRDVIMIIKGTRIQVGSFIKFVRNKLGGGHFDTADRKKWQKELAVMTEYYNNDRDFLNHMMKQLLRSVWEGVWENRIEQHATRIWRS
jgi:hypothetical protein